MKKKIFVTRRLLKENEEKLKTLFEVTLNKDDKIYTPQEIIDGSKNFDGILSSVTDPINADTISKLSDRMGMRLEGKKIENIVDTNIRSEGLIKGVIQVPADGNPIIMLSDHGTIGGYPKIGVVISADYDKLVQLTPGSTIKSQEVDLNSAENLFKLYDLETQNLISQI